MEFALSFLCALLASWMTFYSGFGLGTLLMPIIALFFPLPIAIGFTAIVHLFHNLVKTGILWKAIDWKVAFKFGITALLGAILGALLLKKLSFLTPFKEYSFFSIHGKISVLGILIGLLILFFATWEMFFSQTRFKVKNLFLGGAISGFFGGLSGNQGAFRSAYLVNMNLDTRSFIATNAIIATVVDVIRLIIYTRSFGNLLKEINPSLLVSTLIAAFLGICLGMIFIKKITIHLVQKAIFVLLYLLGILFIAGII